MIVYEFWYDYVKPKYSEKAKLCFMDTFVVYMKLGDICKDTTEDVKTRFGTSNYELDRQLPIFYKEKNKKVTRLMKDGLDEKIITKFVGLRAKIYTYLIYDDSEDKKAKGTNKSVP